MVTHATRSTRILTALLIILSFALARVSAGELQTEDVASYFPGASLVSPSQRQELTLQLPSLEIVSELRVVPDAERVERGADISFLPLSPYRGRVFGNAFVASGAQEAQNRSFDAGGFDVGSFGGALGQDWKLTDNIVWGYGAQLTQTTLDAKNSNSYDESLDSLAGFVRISVFDALWRVDLTYGGSRNWARETSLLNGSTAKFKATQWFFDSEFGARFDKGYTRIDPRINLRVLSLVEPGTAETFLNSRDYVKDFSDNSFRLKIGSRFSWEYENAFGIAKPYITLDWSHEFGNRSIYTIGDQAIAPVAYRQGLHRMPRDKADFGVGLDYALRDELDLSIRYDAEIAKEYADHIFFASFNKKY